MPIHKKSNPSNLLCIFRLVLLSWLLSSPFLKAQVRQPTVAGTFYPADPQQLAHLCQKYLDQVNNNLLHTKPSAIIIPHAGYVYSGPVAAYGFKTLEGYDYSTVILLAPSHVSTFPFASVYSGDFYATPLGKLAVNKNIAKQLSESGKNIKFSTKGHTSTPYQRGEHAIEVELPFLQTALQNFSIVPIIIGGMQYDVLEELGNALAKTIAKHDDILIVVSSDLAHYQPYQECIQTDKRLIAQLRQLDPRDFYQGLARQKYQACGGGPMTVMLITAQELNIDHIKILNHATSGDVPQGGKSRVVGYLAAALYKQPEKTKGNSMNMNSADRELLNPEEQHFILNLARQTVESVVKGKSPPQPAEMPAIVQEKRGAFVTLNKNDQLRGCIGYVQPIKPLYQTIMDVAESAALRDPRFPAVNPQELPDITIEVSVLTVPKIITDSGKIEVGKHGIIIKRGFQQGLLLPQVATEYRWDRKTFLEHTCLKAGLPKNAWQSDKTEIKIFTAQVFSAETLQNN